MAACLIPDAQVAAVLGCDVQFRMPRWLACIVGLSLVSATDILIYTVDPRDWTTNQINAV